jgi:adenine-specific DNA-methyltransferase
VSQNPPISTSNASTVRLGFQESGALAVLSAGIEEVVLADDCDELNIAGEASQQSSLTLPGPMKLLPEADHESMSRSKSLIRLPGGAEIIPDGAQTAISPAIGPIVRALTSHAVSNMGDLAKAASDSLLPGAWRLTGGSPSLHKLARKLSQSSDEWSTLANRDFANSAPYMGTKRLLLPFIMTALETLIDPPDCAIDLMCGSGIVSGALARKWPTIASDSQQFCRSLAVVQGGGFTRELATDTLRNLQEPMLNNMRELSTMLSDLLEMESKMFYNATDFGTLSQRYSEFVASTPGFPIGGATNTWDPMDEIGIRQEGNTKIAPYCLTTAYFANVYFGIRQAVEIDSLRYAIDQLENPLQREWALGALVVAASSIATTYGGHFAQPPAPPNRLLVPNVTKRVLSQRHVSAIREFEIRLLSLAMESEGIGHQIDPIPGPWQSALLTASGQVEPRKTIVYLDAPYRREEYSRYYHVLEALVEYQYPSADASARIAAKGDGRFSSEFFTRNKLHMTKALAQTIEEILSSGFKCAWSYADRADANPLDVLNEVGHTIKRVRSVAADHTFKSQGGSRKSGRVREFLFLIEP